MRTRCVWAPSREGISGLLTMLVVTLLGCLATTGISQAATKIFWVEKTAGVVRSSDVDGTNVADVATGLSQPLTVTVAGNKVYWVATTGTIERSDFDGSNRELLASGLNVPRAVAVDLDIGKLYWSVVGKIVIADLDGSNPTDFITGLSTPLEIEIDASGGFMYWSDSGQGTIYRADYPSGANVTPHISTVGPFGLDLDLVNGKIYWARQGGAIGTRTVERANLDGSGIETLVTLNDPQGVAVDPHADALFWSDQGTSKIQTSDLDGNGTQDLHTGLSHPGGIDLGVENSGAGTVPNGALAAPLLLQKGVGDEIDLTWSSSCVATDTDYAVVQGRLGDPTSHLALECSTSGLTMASVEPREGLFWTEKTVGSVRRSDLDGSDADNVRTGLSQPLTVTVAGSKLYWVATSGTIERSDFDGSNYELLVSGLNVPRAVAVDLDIGKMYWSEVGKIVIADLDGSNPSDFITGLSTPLEIELDSGGGFMYWSDSGQDTIYRAEYPSGANVTSHITTDGPFGLDLDLVNGRIYWAKQSGPIGTRTIERANLDGSGVETLITLNDPQGVAVDPHGNALFWSDQGTSKLQMSDLDGNNVRDLRTGVSAPGGIDIDQSQQVYFLVVPLNGTNEGSYGTDSVGTPRGQGETICAPRLIATCP